MFRCLFWSSSWRCFWAAFGHVFGDILGAGLPPESNTERRARRMLPSTENAAASRRAKGQWKGWKKLENWSKIGEISTNLEEFLQISLNFTKICPISAPNRINKANWAARKTLQLALFAFWKYFEIFQNISKKYFEACLNQLNFVEFGKTWRKLPKRPHECTLDALRVLGPRRPALDQRQSAGRCAQAVERLGHATGALPAPGKAL